MTEIYSILMKAGILQSSQTFQYDIYDQRKIKLGLKNNLQKGCNAKVTQMDGFTFNLELSLGLSLDPGLDLGLGLGLSLGRDLT